jgi:amino acid transporter
MNGANSISTKASTRLNNFFVLTKFFAILGVVLAGIAVVILGASNPDRDIGGKDWWTRPWFGFRETINPDGTRLDWSKLGEWDILGHYSAALYGALWAYCGWDKVSYTLFVENQGKLTSCRRSTSQLNFQLQLVSFHLRSTPLFPQ